jgi:Zn-dependent protease with chaperone function
VTSSLATLALALLAGAGFALATSAALALAWPALRGILRRSHPAAAAGAALAAAVAPAALPLLLLALCFVPGLLGLAGLHADHCTHHPDHPHLCLVHATAQLTGPLPGLLLLGGGLLLGGLARGGVRLARARRALAGLRLGATGGLAPGVRLVESDRPFSVTAGLGAGLGGCEIYVSTALARALPPGQLEAVVAHERAHARRRDGLRRALARALSRIHLPGLRRRLLAELELAGERACDEEAGRQLGDRLRVAEAILAVERLLAGAPASAHPALLAFGGSSVAERVGGLLAAPPARPPRAATRLAASALLLAALLLADPLHHATEHLLGRLLGAL